MRRKISPPVNPVNLSFNIRFWIFRICNGRNAYESSGLLLDFAVFEVENGNGELVRLSSNLNRPIRFSLVRFNRGPVFEPYEGLDCALV